MNIADVSTFEGFLFFGKNFINQSILPPWRYWDSSVAEI